jgi:tetratricopeptide (TPR) repeat protein
VPLYQQANNPKGLAGAIEVKLHHEQDPDGRLILLQEVASLYETKLKDPAKAFERFLAAFEIAPSDDQCIQDVERAARVTGEWDKLVASYKAMIQRADEQGDRDLGIDLRLRLGRVLVDEVKRVDDALAEFRAVYEIDGENAQAIGALERLYRETGRYSELLGIYEKKRDLASDPAERKQIHYFIAELYVSPINDVPSAILTYNKVLEDEPMDAQALAALDKLYLLQQDWDNYVDVLRKRIEIEDEEGNLVDLKYRLGSTLEKHLSDPAGALENYREILLIDPNNDAARVALESAAHERGAAGRGRGHPAGDLRGSRRLGEAHPGARDPRRRRGRHGRSGRAPPQGSAHRRGEPWRSRPRLRRAGPRAQGRSGERDDPRGAGAARLAGERLGQARRDLQRDRGRPRGRQARARVLDAARGHRERLGKVDDAAQNYQRVLAIDPADDEALAAMDALYRRTERWNDLIGVYRRRIELATEPSDRETLYAQMAEVYESKLGRPDEAIAAYREVLALDDTSKVALTALDGLFSRQSMWEELADNLEAQLRLATEEAEQTLLMLRLAALRESQMNQIETAIDIYRQVLERDPENADALAALERLGTMPEHELAIAEILEPLYRQSGDFQKLIGVHEVQVRRSDDPAPASSCSTRSPRSTRTPAETLDSAFDTFARALAEDPGLDTRSRASTGSPARPAASPTSRRCTRISPPPSRSPRSRAASTR